MTETYFNTMETISGIRVILCQAIFCDMCNKTIEKSLKEFHELHLCEKHLEELKKYIKDFEDNLSKSQVDVPTEIDKIVDQEFWNIL